MLQPQVTSLTAPFAAPSTASFEALPLDVLDTVAAEHGALTATISALRCCDASSSPAVLELAAARWQASASEQRLAASARGMELALGEIPGTSAAADGLRATMFVLAFGADLAKAERYSSLLRSTPIWLDVEPGPTRQAVLSALSWAGASRDKDGAYRQAPIAALHGSGSAPSEHLDLLVGIDKSASYTGNTKRGVLEAAGEGVALIRDPASLSSEAYAALEQALETQLFRRRGDSRDRALRARVVLCGDLGELPITSTAMHVPLVGLGERTDDVEAVAIAGLAAGGVTLATGSLPTEVLRQVALHAPAGHSERAVVAAARSALLLGAAPPAVASTNVVAAEPPVVALPDGIRFGLANFEEVKGWYARHVRTLCNSDVEASARLDIHRVTLAKYLRGG